MAKIKGWTKINEYMWRTDLPTIGNNLYDYIFICSGNIVRVVDGKPKNPKPIGLLKYSYIMYRGKTLREAKDYAIKFMKSSNKGGDIGVFMYEVKKLFPNATEERVFHYLRNGNPYFTLEFGGVSMTNIPKEYHNLIRRINRMAGAYRKEKGFALKTMQYQKI